MAALDKECYNTHANGGVYSDCSDKSMSELYDAMDMNLGRLVDYAQLAETVKTCAPYKGYAVEKWLSAKKVVETSAVKDSEECIFAKQKLAAATKCYSAALSHDGNFFEFENLMKRSCGQYPEVWQKFAKAGDIGLGNLPKLLENWSTMQFTNKNENWKSQIEAVLVGYMYSAKSACGEDNYEIIEFNQLQPDTRENLLTIMNKGFADQLGQNAATRIQTSVTIGAPAGQNVAATNEKKNEEIYAAFGWKDAVAGKSPGEAAGKAKKETYKAGNVYTIDEVSNLGTARARLVAIVQNGSIGTAESQDDLDRKIIVSLGGRAGDPGIYNIISAMQDGDTFIIKENGGMCQAMYLKNKALVKLASAEMDAMPSLYGYMRGCRDIIE
jgi:hypothetical protein